MEQSIWQNPDGSWTLAGHVARSLHYPTYMTAAEFFFVLTSLDEERFRWLWDYPEFLQTVGMVDSSDRAVVLEQGNTDFARSLVDRIPRIEEFVRAAAELFDDFIEHGDPGYLDAMQIMASPTGIPVADEIVMSAAIHSRDQPLGSVIWIPEKGDRQSVTARFETNPLARLPARRLTLIRRIGYPYYKFLPEFVAVASEMQVTIEPSDVIDGILSIPWHKVPYWFDEVRARLQYGSRPIDKGDLLKNRAWVEILVQERTAAFDPANWQSEEAATAMLHEVFVFLLDRFNAMRSDGGWIKEGQLGAALEVLFGKDEVQRHARPEWLGQQHFDFFLPRYGLAIEYMGLQHFEPVEWFGGPQGLAAIKERDERKRALCEKMGIQLIYVTYEEDVGRRAREIYAQASRLEATTER